jgi:isopropylmalate/homocitrate/citramalate synthase
MGIFIIDVGYPALSEEEKNNIKKIANEGFQQATLVASARPSKTDVDTCLGCGIHEIAIITPFNGFNLQYRLKLTKEEVQQRTKESIEHAKHRNAKVDFVLEDASRTPIEDILKISGTAIRAGADRLVIADTVGFMRPLSIRYLVSHINEGLAELKLKEVPMAIHCHNDFGLATANTLAAIEEGVAYVHTSIAGFGERAGCAPMEEVVTALELLYDIDTGIELDKLYRMAQLAEKTFALPIQFHKPIIGENAFSYEADEHVQAILAHPLLFEPFPHEITGRETTFYLGRQSGKHMVENRLKEAEIKANPVQIEEIVKRLKGTHESLDKGEAQMTFYQIKKLMKDLRKGITEEEFWKIVEQVTRQKPKLPPPPESVSPA